MVYCGIDTSHFTPKLRTRQSGETFHILSSGRLVSKKGFPVVIEACKILKPRNFDFYCTIEGSGPDETVLCAQITQAGLEDKITLTGKALKQENIPTFMYGGDVYTLPCVWATDNDVDGLPQMLMEAMACGLPTVSTWLVGIPDLVIDGETGLLVEPNDAEALAGALQRMANEPALATAMAEAGHTHVTKTFDLNTCLNPLLDRYKTALEQSS